MKALQTIKKVIYYYYDEVGNRRPIGVSDEKQIEFLIDENWINHMNKTFPKSISNLYMQFDGKEFKLD
ncbi:hypothetical protein [Staphylococcus aureus]|uniref:hypothetical protein n=1 Tax=Staphylococcus aureus TaxID=1280 RepID=UPI000447682F|nr:hypothetical protein [Staphylococcus aureus]EZY65399.1 hypothetical protein V061_00007 [Staphylococcus aureus R0353]EZY66192.1 hypothetical protein V060_00007 [Staphylococcus aureus R0294]EZY68650.1 hypothetical protein V064_02606 [Staphylococcus aureus R0545]EZY68717.1 hypothetical protein V062_00022 [Staphylococcus aureus R0357]EZY71519.1 hypothetical protein V063_01267 [Staphylococcus aureus R0487]